MKIEESSLFNDKWNKEKVNNGRGSVEEYVSGLETFIWDLCKTSQCFIVSEFFYPLPVTS